MLAAISLGQFLRSCRTHSPHRRHLTLLGPEDPAPFSVFHRGRHARIWCCSAIMPAGPFRKALGHARPRARASSTSISPGISASPASAGGWPLARRAAVHDRLFAAGDRLQPAPRRSDLDPAGERPHAGARQSRPVAGGSPAARRRRFSTPYHMALATDDAAKARWAAHVPVVISLHSFTPVMNGFQRPWHVGVLWNRDARLPCR